MYQSKLGEDNYQKAQLIIEQQAKTAENKLDKMILLISPMEKLSKFF